MGSKSRRPQYLDGTCESTRWDRKLPVSCKGSDVPLLISPRREESTSVSSDSFAFTFSKRNSESRTKAVCPNLDRCIGQIHSYLSVVNCLIFLGCSRHNCKRGHSKKNTDTSKWASKPNRWSWTCNPTECSISEEPQRAAPAVPIQRDGELESRLSRDKIKVSYS